MTKDKLKQQFEKNKRAGRTVRGFVVAGIVTALVLSAFVSITPIAQANVSSATSSASPWSRFWGSVEIGIQNAKEGIAESWSFLKEYAGVGARRIQEFAGRGEGDNTGGQNSDGSIKLKPSEDQNLNAGGVPGGAGQQSNSGRLFFVTDQIDGSRILDGSITKVDLDYRTLTHKTLHKNAVTTRIIKDKTIIGADLSSKLSLRTTGTIHADDLDANRAVIHRSLQMLGSIDMSNNKITRLDGFSGNNDYVSLFDPTKSAPVSTHSLDDADDLLIGGNLEVTEEGYFKNGLTIDAGAFSHTGTTSILDLTGAINWDTDSSMTVGAQTFTLTTDGGGIDLNGAVGLNGNVTVAGNIVPSANSTYNLGSAANHWDTVYTDSIVGVLVVGGDLDMQNNRILNIGAAGTDFSATGGLTLSDTLTLDDAGIQFTGGAEPGVPANGLMYYDLATSKYKYFNGVEWKKVGGGNWDDPNVYTVLVAGATTHGLADANDALIPGNLEVDSETWFDGAVNFGSNILVTGAVNGLTLASAADGFTVSGGTIPRTLTVTGSNITLTGGGNTLTLTGNASLNQNLLTTSGPTFVTVNTGQGDNELYAMDQDVRTSDAPTFVTLNTGLGAYELYAMDQNVRTSDSPIFAGLTLNGTLTMGNNAIDGTNYDIAANGTITGATWNGGIIGLAYGGTAKNMVPSNGGIVYTDGDSQEVLAGTATANQMLMSGAGAAPTWSTATYPATAAGTGTVLRADGTNWVASTSTFADTYGINTLLYASGANTVTGLATAASSVLVTDGAGAPSWTAMSGDIYAQYALLAGRASGQTLIGGTGVTDDLTLRSTSGVGEAGADIIFQVGNNGGTEAMRILNSGNVGIGTNNPTTKLHVLGTTEQLRLGYDVDSYAGFTTADTGNLAIATTGTTVSFQTATADAETILSVLKNGTGAASLYLEPGTQPATSAAGKMYYDLATNKFKYYNGTSWTQIGGGNWADPNVYTVLVAGVTTHGMADNTDLLIPGNLEVDSDAWFDANLTVAGTINGLTLTSAADGFTISGGTTPRTLTVTGGAVSLNNFSAIGNGNTLTMNASASLNQSLETTSSPTFAGLTLTGDLLHNANPDADFIIKNLDLNQDIAFQVNSGGVNTELLRLDASTPEVTVGTGGTVMTVDASGLTFTGGGLFHDGTPDADFVIRNLDQDKDIVFYTNDGGVNTEMLRLSANNTSVDLGTGSVEMTITSDGNVGIGTTTPGEKFVVGTDKFQVNSNGNLVKVNNVSYSWPGAQGAATTYLRNDGAGNLTWETAATSSAWSSLTNPSANLSLSMAAYTSTMTWSDATGANNLFTLTDTLNNSGTGYLANFTTASGSTLKPFHVSAAGTEALMVDASARVGMGTATPSVKLHVWNAGEQLRLSNSDGNYASFTVDGTGDIALAPSGGDMSVTGNVLPTTDDTYTLGSAGLRWKDLYLGPASLHIVSKVAETTVARDWQIGIQETDGASEGNFRIMEGVNEYFAINTSGNVGIGTTNPSYLLDVYHASTTNLFRLNYNGTDVMTVTDAQTTINNPVLMASAGDVSISYDLLMTNALAGNIKFSGPGYIMTESGFENLDLTLSAAGTGQIVVDDNAYVSGNVGIGTTSPNMTGMGGTRRWLSVLGSSANGVLELGSNQGDIATTVGIIDFPLLTNTAGNGLAVAEIIASSVGATANDKGGYLRFFTKADGGTLTEKVRIDENGNVGIGQLTPSQKLEVNGTIRITAASGGGITFADGTSMTTAAATATGMTSATDLTFAADSDANGSGVMTYATAGVERMRIANNGNVGIGTNNPGYKLHLSGSNTVGLVQSSTVYSDLRFQNTTSSLGFLQYRDNDWMIYANSGATPTMTITGGAPGNVGIGTTAPSGNLEVSANGGLNVELRTAVDTSSYHSALNLRRSRGTTASRTVVSAGDAIGSLRFFGYNDDFRYAAGIYGEVDTGVGATGADMPGRLTFLTSPDGTATPVERMRITSGGYVGIGTNNPNTLLHVSNTSGAPVMTLQHGGGINNFQVAFADEALNYKWHIITYGDTAPGLENAFAIYQGKNQSDVAVNAYRMLINDSGNVGIGTTTPGEKLVVGTDIGGSAFTNPESRIAVGNPSGTSGYDMGEDANNRAWMLWNNTDNYLHFGSRSASTNYNYMLALRDGNVGIGTTGPGATLDVQGNGTLRLGIDDNTRGNLWLRGAGAGQTTGGYLALFTSADHDTNYDYFDISTESETLQFQDSANNVLMTLKGGGSVGIGTTSPDVKLHVYGSGNLYSIVQTTDVDGIAGMTVQNDVQQWLLRVAGSNSDRFEIRDGTLGSSKLVVGTDGNVGIGTTGPDSKIEVSSLDDTRLKLTDTGGSNEIVLRADIVTSIYSNSNQNLQFGANGNDALMALTPGGNVGIGTTTPDAKLVVNSGVAGTGGLKFTQLTSGSAAGVGGGKVLSLDASGNVILVNDQTGSADALPAGTTGQTIYHNGVNWSATSNLYHNGANVGIGTDSPTYEFELYKSENSEMGARIVNPSTGDSAYTIMRWGTDAASDAYVFRVGNNFSTSTIFQPGRFFVDNSVAAGTWVGSRNAAGIVGFFTGGSDPTNERMRITSNGNVGIGTTGPLALFDVNGVGAFSAGLVNAPGMAIRTDLDTGIWSSGSNTLNFSTGGSERVRINSSGYIGIGATTVDDPLHLVGQFRIDNDTDTTNKGCFRYNGTSHQLEYSNDCSTFQSLSASSAGGWTDDGAVVRQSATSDTVGIGTTTTTAKVDIVATSEQLRLLYDDTHYTSFTTSIAGNLTIAPSAGNLTVSGHLLPGGANYDLGSVSAPWRDLYLSGSSLKMYNAYTDVGNYELGKLSYASNVFTLSSTAAGTGTVRPIQITTGSNAGLYMNVDGNVGIGTTGPASILHTVGDQNTFDRYGGSVGLIMRRANGTSGAPSQVLADQVLSTIGVRPYLSDTGVFSASSLATINMYAAENITSTTGGTYMAFQTTPTGSVTQAERMRITSGGNIGIGTTNPSKKLTIESITDGNGANISLNSSTNGQYTGQWFSVTTDQATGYQKGAVLWERTGTNGRGSLHLAVDTADDTGSAVLSDAKLTINSSGNVGIGTTGPNDKLDVYQGNIRITDRMLKFVGTTSGSYTRLLQNQYASGDVSTGSSVFTYLAENDYGNSRWSYSGNGQASGISLYEGNTYFVRAGTGATGDALTWSTSMAINSSGKVGIGTNNPGHLLTVAGTGYYTSGEKITNGTFDSNISGWTDVSGPGSSVSWSANYGGSMYFDGSAAWAMADQAVTTKPGVRYKITVEAKAVAIAGFPLLWVGTTSGNNDLLNTNVGSVETHTFFFTATTSTTYLRLRDGYTGSYVDNVSITEVSLVAEGSVGVGTSNPYAALSVNRSLSTTIGLKPSMQIENNFGVGYLSEIGFGYRTTGYNYSNAVIGARGADWGGHTNSDIYFATRNVTTDTAPVERMTIKNSGNIGIGTTAPTSNLQMVGVSYSDPSLGAGASAMMSMQSGSGTDLVIGSMQNSPFTAWVQHRHATNNGSSYPIALQPSGGYVEIGGTSPIAKLSVYNGSSTSYADGLYIGPDSSAVGLSIWYDNASFTDSYIESRYNSDASRIRFRTKASGTPVEAMTILGSGYVGIGTTGPDYALRVQSGAVAGNGAYVNLASHSSKKEAFEDTQVLAGISQLNIKEWQYKAEYALGDNTRHLYPFADDFYAKFGLGKDEWRITSEDIAGVAMKGVQEILKVADITSAPLTSPTIAINAFGNMAVANDLSVGGNLTAAKNLSVAGRLDAGTEGVATKVKDGTVEDADFVSPASDGLMAIDSANGRIYFRYADSWHYVNQTGGFQIPNYETAPQGDLSTDARVAKAAALPFEHTNHPEYISEKMQPGDFLIPYADEYMEDGAVHGLYARFEDVKSLMFGEEQAAIADLVLKTDQNISTIEELQNSVDENLKTVGTSLQGLVAMVADVEDETDERLDDVEYQTEQLVGRVDKLETALAQNDLAKAQLEMLNQLINPAEDGTLTVYGNMGLHGKLDADGVITSMLAIKNNIDVAPTIGQASISKGEKSSILVPTTAITKSAKVFYSFENDPGTVSWVEKVADDDPITAEGYKGFRINLREPVATDVPVMVSWWIVECSGSDCNAALPPSASEPPISDDSSVVSSEDQPETSAEESSADATESDETGSSSEESPLPSPSGAPAAGTSEEPPLSSL